MPPSCSAATDNFQNLVFYGDDLPGIQKHVEDFKPCDYLGQKGRHLCWHDGLKRGVLGGPKPYGRKAIFDETYAQVSINYTYPEDVNHTFPNSHEMRPVDDGYAFLEPTYVPREMDLTPYGGQKDGWVWDACFQEIDTETGGPNFEWCYMDYYPVWETNLFMPFEGSMNVTSDKAGHGTEDWPWDAFHINSIDKNTEGDYLVSIRHLDQVLKIAGNWNSQGLKAGDTIWRLGGKSNDFDMGDLTFSKQHAVRSLSITRENETLSIFDNAWEGTNKPSANFSSGMIITVNNTTMSAKLDVDFPHPKEELSPSQGNMQNLADGNVIIGWGALPQITEYSHDGIPLWHATFFKDADREDMSYRAFKGDWIGKPYWKPKLLAYSPTCVISDEYPLTAYVSWNGATEVKKWHFYTSITPEGPWLSAGIHEKESFETKAVLSSRLTAAISAFAPYVLVEALDQNGDILGSTSATTFVPGIDTIKRKECHLEGCKMGFDYAPRESCAELCHKSLVPAMLALVVVLIVIEVLNYAAQSLQIWLVERRRGYVGGGFKKHARYNSLRPDYAKKIGLHQA